MVKGYYMAASGMLTESKKLNAISTNLANVSTPGYKVDSVIPTTFEETLLARTGNNDRSNTQVIGSTSAIITPGAVHTDFTQGTIEQTDRVFDFAIKGDGFFRVNTPNGDVFTRNGSFTLDDQGYLALQHVGRVQGAKGDILIGQENFHLTAKGGIEVSGELVDTIDITDFTDYNLIYKSNEGVFTNLDEQNEIPSQATVVNRAIERSNMESTEELTNMLMSQRSIQSCSQMVKIFDELIAKTVTEIGRV